MPKNPNREAWHQAIAAALEANDIGPMQELKFGPWTSFRDEYARLQAIKIIITTPPTGESNG